MNVPYPLNRKKFLRLGNFEIIALNFVQCGEGCTILNRVILRLLNATHIKFYCFGDECWNFIPIKFH
jgi:hypothetical protein